MKSRRIFIIGSFSILSILGLILVNTKSITEGNLNYLRDSEKENKQSFQGASDFYKILKADPITGQINPAYVYAAQQQLNMMSRSRAGMAITWDFRGPDNIGGRTRALIVDNKDHNTLYAGGVSGGIFKSVTGGEHWVVKTYTAEMGGLIISCGAQAPNGDIYFGTGEQQFTNGSDGTFNSGSMGGGIYKSTDRGETWTRLAATDPATATRWQNVYGIAINPKSGVVYAATQLGLMESADAGATWTKYPGAIVSPSTTSYIDVKVSPDGNTVFAAIISSAGCKVYRSINRADLVQIGAATISQSTTRLVLAISPSNPNYVYVSAASTGAGNSWGRNALDGIYRSTDNGDTWTKIVLGGTETEPFGSGGGWQGNYDNCIAVDPYNPNRFFMGGVDFYMYDDGMWYKAAGLSEFTDSKDTYVNPYYIHADKHFITFDTVAKPYKMYVTTDGGVAVSTNAQSMKYPTYKTMNINFTTTQFYALGANRYDDIVGGTQDNGTFVIETNSLSGKSGKEILGGDGFYAELSRYDQNTFITESQYGYLNRSKDRGVNQQTLLTGKLTKALKANNGGNYPFCTPFRLWEDKVHMMVTDSNHNPVYFDSLMQISKLFFAPIGEVWVNLKSHDFSADAVEWFKISNTSMPAYFYAISMEYTADGNTLFIGGSGMGGGSLYRITGLKDAVYKFDGSGNFDPDLANIKTELIKSWANRVVTGIGISPGNNNNVVVTLGNYVSSGLDHVYLSTNALDVASNVIFSSIQGTGAGKLPAMPAYDAAIHSLGNTTDSIIIGTELGVFTTINGGTSWTESNNGMARVPTYMIRQIHVSPWHNGFNYYIATHGRGIFSTKFGTNLGISDKSEIIKPDLSVYPNPASSTTNVAINLTKTSNITIQVYDLNGRAVQTYNFNQAKAGKNIYPLNTSTFMPGTYLVRATYEGQNITSKLFISR